MMAMRAVAGRMALGALPNAAIPGYVVEIRKQKLVYYLRRHTIDRPGMRHTSSLPAQLLFNIENKICLQYFFSSKSIECGRHTVVPSSIWINIE